MLSSTGLDRSKRDAAGVGRYSVHMSLILSVVVSLAAIAILSKRHRTDYLWVHVAAFVIPMPIALYFRNRIVLVGAVTYLAVLMVVLAGAVIFGI